MKRNLSDENFFLRKFSCRPNCIYHFFYNACNLILSCLYIWAFTVSFSELLKHIHITQIVLQFQHKNISSLKLCSECSADQERWFQTHFLLQVKKFIRSRPQTPGTVSLLQNGGRSKECAPEETNGELHLCKIYCPDITMVWSCDDIFIILARNPPAKRGENIFITLLCIMIFNTGVYKNLRQQYVSSNMQTPVVVSHKGSSR